MRQQTDGDRPAPAEIYFNEIPIRSRQDALIQIVSIRSDDPLPVTCPICGAPAAWRDMGWTPYKYSRGGVRFWLCNACQGVKVRRFEIP